MKHFHYYDILGVREDADEEQIRSALHRLSKMYHPDVCKEPNAEAHFKRILKAYEVLGNPQRRKEYDQAVTRQSRSCRIYNVCLRHRPPVPSRRPGSGFQRENKMVFWGALSASLVAVAVLFGPQWVNDFFDRQDPRIVSQAAPPGAGASSTSERPATFGQPAAMPEQEPSGAAASKPAATTNAAPSPQADDPAVARQELLLDLGNSITMRLVLIPAGQFEMGSLESEAGHATNESPRHEVTISKPFYLGVYDVTQEQYEQVMGVNPSSFKGRGNPVEQVAWPEAEEFCQKVSARTGKDVRLPTEAQWEYACRAGTATPFYTGDSLTTFQASFADAYLRNTTAVGTFKPNAFGLYDMHGNLWQWCRDWYGQTYYTVAKNVDPQGPATGLWRVMRGGSWNSDQRRCRSACRDGCVPFGRSDDIGFRVAVMAD